jgi:hypothetical protein
MRPIGFFLICILTPFSSLATHLKGGEITYKIVDATTRTVEVTLKLFRDTAPGSVDQPDVSLNFGDGSNCQSVKALSREQVGNTTEVITYKTLHSFPTYGRFILSFNEENRNENINSANSVDVSLYIHSLIAIDVFDINNHSFQFFKNTGFNALVGKELSYTSIGYDPDGDSLAFTLIKPSFLPSGSENCTSETSSSYVPGYYLPDSAYINPYSGNIKWTPSKVGPYSFVVKVSEYRKGQLIGYVIKDFQIEVRDDDIDPKIERIDGHGLKPFEVLDLVMDETVTLRVRYQSINTNFNLEAFSELLTNNIGSFEVRDSGVYKVGTFRLPFSQSLKRAQIYLMTFRGTCTSGNSQSLLDFTYILNPNPAIVLDTTGNPPSIDPDEAPLSLDEKVRLKKVEFYPNPVKENFFVNTTQVHTPEILIYNASGALLKWQRLPQALKARVETTGISRGTNFFIIKSNGQKWGWGKFILE